MFSMDCYFRQQWTDTRLAFEPTNNISELRPSIKMLDKIWKPDTFFLNGQSSYLHTITYENKLFRITVDGNVLYSQRWATNSIRNVSETKVFTAVALQVLLNRAADGSQWQTVGVKDKAANFVFPCWPSIFNVFDRLTIKSSCPMFLHKYPLDSQNCPLYLGSCKWQPFLCEVMLNIFWQNVVSDSLNHKKSSKIPCRSLFQCSSSFLSILWGKQLLKQSSCVSDTCVQASFCALDSPNIRHTKLNRERANSVHVFTSHRKFLTFGGGGIPGFFAHGHAHQNFSRVLSESKMVIPIQIVLQLSQQCFCFSRVVTNVCAFLSHRRIRIWRHWNKMERRSAPSKSVLRPSHGSI